MQCPACEVAFHESVDIWHSTGVSNPRNPNLEWIVLITTCPSCKEPIVKLDSLDSLYERIIHSRVIYPTHEMPSEVNVDPSVPEDLATNFVEASSVLPISAKASAAISRRVLQSILNEQGYKGGNLAKQVDAILSETDARRALPLYVRNKIDVIRNFGNFSAHPITDLTTLQIIDVEPEEAEWCLEIVSALFEHYYIRPADDERKLDELNQKLASAGKLPAKQ